MKSRRVISALVATAAVCVGAAACSTEGELNEGSAGSSPVTTCGPGTRLEGSQCVVDDVAVGAGGTGGGGAGGAAGGWVWAETDSTVYPYAGVATVTLHNDGPSIVYMRLCPSWGSVLSGALHLDKLDASAWVEQCARVGCDDADSITNRLRPGATLETQLGFNDGYCWFGAGTGRTHYTIGYDCQKDAPWSEARCARLEEVYSPAFTVEDCICPVSEGRVLCPTLESLCSVGATMCPPLTIADALAPGAPITSGCDRRVQWSFLGSPDPPNVHVYDELTGELVGACISQDVVHPPCNVSTYCFGDTQYLGGTWNESFVCPDVVDCQYVGDAMVPENWTCSAGAGGVTGGTPGDAGAAGVAGVAGIAGNAAAGGASGAAGAAQGGSGG